MSNEQYLAILDLGSNSVRLKITKIQDNGSFETVQYEKRYVRLASNMGPEKMLKSTPVKRTIDALKEFRAICDRYRNKNLTIIAVATAAVRQAQNQLQFLEKVQRETGFEIHVISGEREAYLDYVGVNQTLPIDKGIIIDTGGASMELISVNNGEAEKAVSIPIGSVSISQTYHLEDQINPAWANNAFRRSLFDYAAVIRSGSADAGRNPWNYESASRCNCRGSFTTHLSCPAIIN